MTMYPVDTGIKFNSWTHPSFFCIDEKSTHNISIKKEVFKIGNIYSTYRVDSLEFSFGTKFQFLKFQNNSSTCENDLNGCSPYDDFNMISKMSKRKIAVPVDCPVFVKGYKN